MSRETTQNSSAPESVSGGQAKNASTGISRRALLRAGTGATPVLLTFASGPVAAVPFGQCVLASSFVSVATFQSRNPNGVLGCASRNMEYWRAEAGKNPNNGPVSTALDKTVSAYLGAVGSTYDGATVRSVLLASPGGVATSGELGTLQHLLVMSLNLASGSMPTTGGFDPLYLQSIWSNYKSNGNHYIVAASGIDWVDAQIIGWARLLLGYPLPP